MNSNINISNPADLQPILTAFQIIATPGSSQENIKSADQYLLQCQNNGDFSLILMSLFTQLPHGLTKTQVLIHLKNVIRRNWTSHRKSSLNASLPQNIKQQVKSKLLEIYKNNWKFHYKDFNQIFKYLARQDFPLNYQALNSFIQQVLGTLASFSLQQILNSQQLLPYLSLVKVVYKQYGERMLLHSVEAFNNFCKQTIANSTIILQKINQALSIIKSEKHQIQLKISQKVLQCSRKVDKIILYSLQSIVSSLQTDQQIVKIVQYLLMKTQNLLSLQTSNLSDLAEKNILAIIQLSCKLQSRFPLLFSTFLFDYLQLILGYLFNKNFKNSKLVNILIIANTRPLASFSYYMDPIQYKESLEFKKDFKESYIQQYQFQCNQIYKKVYNSSNISTLLQKIVSQIMISFRRQSQDDQIIFEDTNYGEQSLGEKCTYELILNLLKAIFDRFKQESKVFVHNCINYILTQPSETITKLKMDMFQIILLTSKSSQNLNIGKQTLFVLMQKCYNYKNYDTLCRLIRNFLQQIPENQIPKIFQLLISIISDQNSSHLSIYQSVVCLRNIISQFSQVNLPVEQIGYCLNRIFGLLDIYKGVPTHLWNLLSLLVKLLKTLNIQTIFKNLNYINNYIRSVVALKQSDNLIISALCELLQTLLILVEPEDNNRNEDKLQLYSNSLNLIVQTQVKEQQQLTQMLKHWLWLCIIKNINNNSCPPQLKIILLRLLNQLKEQVIEIDPSLYFEILQQYLLSGILIISTNDLLSLYNELIDQGSIESQIRSIMAFFSLAYTQLLITGEANPHVIVISMRVIKQLSCRISPHINALRMILMSILSQHIIQLGAEATFGTLSSHFTDYKDWFWPFIQSLEYINNKYAGKICAFALLQSLQTLKVAITQEIQCNLPFDFFIKFIINYIEPLQLQQSTASYLNAINQFSHIQQIKQKNKPLVGTQFPRKIRLHINPSFATMDMRPIFKQQIEKLFLQWDWGVDDLEQRYHKNVIDKIVNYLNL